MMKRIPIELYSTGVLIVIESKEESAAKQLKKIGIKDFSSKHMDGCCWTEKGYWPVVWIKSLKDIPLLCHEITHACYGILDAKGLTVSADNHEALTYLQTYILKKLLKK